MSASAILAFLAGLALLVIGAEALVRGASRLAVAAGVSPLVVGLTVVAYGTSSPEMAVSVEAAWRGQGDVALGNVVGSNIFNVLFILGISASLVPLVVHSQLVRVDGPVRIGVSILMWFIARDGVVSPTEGVVLLAGVVAYTTLLVRLGRRDASSASPADAAARAVPGRWVIDVALVAIGLVLLVAGARMLVDAAITLARALGISELVIGLTVVAAGTSMPEVATSIMAAVRGERDIAVGNVVGSNVFNILAVLGASAAVAPGGLPVPAAATSFDLPVAVAVAVACLPVFSTGFTIARWEGVVFLGYYVAYVLYLYLDTSGHAGAAVHRWIMLSFAIPLTVLTLGIVAVRDVARQRGRNAT